MRGKKGTHSFFSSAVNFGIRVAVAEGLRSEESNRQLGRVSYDKFCIY